MTDSVEYPCASCGTVNRVPRDRVHDRPKCGQCHRKLLGPEPVPITDGRWQSEVEGCPIPVLVDFWAEWCGPCRAVAPVLERLAQEREGQLRVVKVDVDRNPKTAARFQIRSIPTLMLVEAGKVRAQRAGALPRAALEAWLDEQLATR